MPSPRALATLLTRRNSFLDQLRLRPANRPVRFSPNRELEPLERGLPCRPNQQWPSALRAVGDDPISKPQLHACAIHTRVAMRAMLGRVFLSVIDARVLAKVPGPAPQSASAEAHSQLLHAFNPANTSRQIGGLVCELAHGTET
jgi:hypothetical protein